MKLFKEFKGQNIFEFMEKFSTDLLCKEYLGNYKWIDGFVCPQCGSTREHHSNDPYTKRCGSCYHKESASAGTLFHKVKFGLRKAFYIVFEMSTTTKSCSSPVYAKKLGINQKTAWLFCQKVRIAMKSSCQYPLEGKVDVDEAFIGEKEAGKRGRGSENKTKIVIAIEKTADEDGIKRAYAEVIEDTSSIELRKIFDNHIDNSSKVKTDKWTGYKPIQKEWDIEMEKSKGGENFELMHRFIMGLKSWLRGIFHHVREEHTQKYLDEYCYRFNRSIFKETIFDKLIFRMVQHEQVIYKQIKLCSPKLNG